MHMVKNIQGTWSRGEDTVAFCAYAKHKGYLTKRQRKAHKCLKRRCVHYVSLKKIARDRETAKKKVDGSVLLGDE